MDEHDWLADRFEENRTHLRAVAYPRAITRVGGHTRFPADRRGESKGNVQPADSAAVDFPAPYDSCASPWPAWSAKKRSSSAPSSSAVGICAAPSTNSCLLYTSPSPRD